MVRAAQAGAMGLLGLLGLLVFASTANCQKVVKGPYAVRAISGEGRDGVARQAHKKQKRKEL